MPFSLLPLGLTVSDLFYSSDFFGSIALGFKKKNEVESGIRGGKKAGRPSMEFPLRVQTTYGFGVMSNTWGNLQGFPDSGSPVRIPNFYHRFFPSVANLFGKTGLKVTTP